MTTALAKIRWRKELDRRGHESKRVSPALAVALRNEIRIALEAGGGPFDINVARRVYDLSIAASDMCAAATDTEIPESVVRRYLAKHDQERNPMSPELSEALRNEIRTTLEAGGGSFDINVARRVYDLAIAARDMCIAATGSVKEAIDQIKDTNGPMETLDSPDTPESQVQVSESFGARLLRELMASLPLLQARREGDDPKQLVHALAEARRNGMHDVAEELEVKLFGCVLSGSRPVTAEEIDVVEGSYEHGYTDGRAGVLPVHEEGPYHVGWLQGTTAKYLDPRGAETATQTALKHTVGSVGYSPTAIKLEHTVGSVGYSTPAVKDDLPTIGYSTTAIKDGLPNIGYGARYDDTELHGRPSNRIPMDPIEREELEGK